LGRVQSLSIKSCLTVAPPSPKVSLSVCVALTDYAVHTWSCTMDLVVRPAASIALRRSPISTGMDPLMRPSRTTFARNSLDVISI
jgi:hypothetical protein